MSKAAKASWDYKNGDEAHKEIIQALREIGAFVYNSPSCEGTDALGVIVSTGPLNDEEIEEIDEE